ncbi:MAG: dihydrolipoyl dehydrogenase [Limnochordia bacterium]|nr:dihydrolipoyl dehydrogenase [Limnochordia bacterium]MDD4518203.1 dihydrolipoyl dehydrogenase [Limnochordia bacterium]
MDYDVLVIGAGAAGYVAALHAANNGLKTVLVEEDVVGGTCLNAGCIPTKALVSTCQILQTIERSKDFGIRVVDVEIDYERVVKRKDQAVTRLRKGIEFLFRKHKLNVLQGHATLLDPHTVQVTNTQVEELTSKNIIVATGSRPVSLFGLEFGDRVISSKEALELRQIPEKLLVIGGGVIGCELGYIFNTLGSSVSIVEAASQLIPGEDAQVSTLLLRSLKKQGIVIHTNTLVSNLNITDEGVIAQLPEGDVIQADQVLISVGRRPYYGDLGLEQIGVEMEKRGGIKVDENMKTNIDGIYAIGDVTGKWQLAHVASAEGLAAVNAILGKPSPVNYGVIPRGIFTSPEIGAVGINLEQAKAQGLDCAESVFSLVANGRAVAGGETEGFVKVVYQVGTGEILGMHIIGAHATELVAEGALAMELGATVADVAKTIHAHPTFAESIQEAARGAAGIGF